MKLYIVDKSISTVEMKQLAEETDEQKTESSVKEVIICNDVDVDTLD